MPIQAEIFPFFSEIPVVPVNNTIVFADHFGYRIYIYISIYLYLYLYIIIYIMCVCVRATVHLEQYHFLFFV